MYISGAGLPRLISRYKNPTGIEIGLNKGDTTRHLFSNLQNLTLHGVDPYLDYVDWDGTSLNNENRSSTYAEFLHNTMEFSDKITHHRMLSDDAAAHIADNSCDFIFIDGLHTYEQVLKDCQNFYPKIKAGGLFAGHDYNVIADVRRAVDEFAASVGATILQTDNDVWYWFKPKRVPIIVCTVNGRCVPVLRKSVDTYCPGTHLIVFENKETTFGEAYNDALRKAFENWDEVIVANDDIVLTPSSLRLLMEDVEAMRLEHGSHVGFVGAHSDSAAHRQNIRYQNGAENTLSPYYNKWDWENVCRKSNIVAPLFAWISKDAFQAAQFPPTNWYSDDVICLDLRMKGYKHFISRSYVHHVGSQTVGQNFEKLNGEAVGWLRKNRPHYADMWFGPDKSVAQPKRKPKICIYAISKNEEQFVSRWAESGKDADLLLVADTGSTDGTVEACRQSGISTHQICITPWRFDHARNASIALIPHDIDICISLDMDEVMEPGWREEIERVWQDDTTRLKYLYRWGEGVEFYYEKIHARHGYFWHHPCHEYPVYDGRIKEVYAFTDKLLVSHHPDPTKSRGQYLDLLALSVKEDPHCPRNAFYYARELSFYARWDESISECQRYLALPSATWANERCYAMRTIAKCYEGKKENAQAEAWLLRAAAEAPHTREPWAGLAMLYYNQSKWQECYGAAVRALSIKEKEFVYTIDPSVWGALPHDLAAVSAWNLGLRDAAIEHGTNAVALSPEDGRLQENLLWFQGKKR